MLNGKIPKIKTDLGYISAVNKVLKQTLDLLCPDWIVSFYLIIIATKCSSKNVASSSVFVLSFLLVILLSLRWLCQTCQMTSVGGFFAGKWTPSAALFLHFGTRWFWAFKGADNGYWTFGLTYFFWGPKPNAWRLISKKYENVLNGHLDLRNIMFIRRDLFGWLFLRIFYQF